MTVRKVLVVRNPHLHIQPLQKLTFFISFHYGSKNRISFTNRMLTETITSATPAQDITIPAPLPTLIPPYFAIQSAKIPLHPYAMTYPICDINPTMPHTRPCNSTGVFVLTKKSRQLFANGNITKNPKPESVINTILSNIPKPKIHTPASVSDRLSTFTYWL